MDAQTGSSSGFDAALKALEDLETDVAQARESAPAPAAIAPGPVGIAAIEAIDFADEVETPAATPEPAAPAAIAPAPVELAVTAVEPEAVAPVAEAVEEPASQPIAPADHAPPVVAVAAPAKRSILPTLAVGLGLFSSIVSAVGLVVVSRTVVSASLVVADARERQAELKKVGTLIHELEGMRARQQILLQQQEAAVAKAPISTQDLDQRIGELRDALIKRDQSAAMIATVHEGQSQLNDTMTAIGAKVSRIEDKMDGRH